MSKIFAHRNARLVALALVLLTLLAIMPAAPVTASPPAQNAGGFLVFGGTVVGAPRVNVRDAPGVNGRILGKLANGARVAVVGRSGNWYLIRYPAAPVGLAWISAGYVQLDGQKPPVAAQPTPMRQPAAPPQPQQTPQPATPTLPNIQVEAPSLVDFNNGRFRWQWYGDQGQLTGVDWYTDILLFYKGDSAPYRTFVANPGEVVQDGPFLAWGEPFNVQCNTEAIARIAVRANGQFIGWVSGPSAPIDVGPKCSSGGGSGGSGGSGGGGNDGGSGGGGGVDYTPPPDDIIDCTNPDWADKPECQQ